MLRVVCPLYNIPDMTTFTLYHSTSMSPRREKYVTAMPKSFRVTKDTDKLGGGGQAHLWVGPLEPFPRWLATSHRILDKRTLGENVKMYGTISL